ncbi:MAG: ATP-dependent DNA ligase [Actinomycetes bacterium]
MLLAEIAEAAGDVTATSSRTAKAHRLARTLREAAPDELPVVVAYLSGEVPQRRTGIGWRSLTDLPPPAASPSLSVLDVDGCFERAQAASGPGSQAARRQIVRDLMSRATRDEQALLASLVGGELRQGAARGVLVEALAVAAGVGADEVRRALTLSGDLAAVAAAGLYPEPAGTSPSVCLARFGLAVGRPLAPMLASSAQSVGKALDRTGPAGVEWKLDGVRVQVHAHDGQVRIWTRSLEEITERLPEVADVVGRLPVSTLVADGEVVGLRDDASPPALASGRPVPFQLTASRVASRTSTDLQLATVLFDVLHADGRDLLDEPYSVRRRVLQELAPELAVPALEVADDDAGRVRAEEFAADAVGRGHEGVVVKALDAPYAMGRRGAAWVKVKPRTTLDLVVLAAEWGHGRRTGYLSNLHLGARDPEGRYTESGGFVMLGKTFKGMTDELLRWQTERLQELATQHTRGTVVVRPELVVEIAVDGVQTSPRYPAGMALRFARVVRYRPDKRADEADTVDDVRRLHVE